MAINDLSSAEELAHLLKYDTVHRSFHENEITFKDDNIIIANRKVVKVFKESNPELLKKKML